MRVGGRASVLGLALVLLVAAPGPALAAPVVTVTPSTIAPGGTLAVTWTGGPAEPSWIGLGAPGSAANTITDYVATGGQAQGSAVLTVAPSRPAGAYPVRWLVTEGSVGTFGPVQVDPGAPPPLAHAAPLSPGGSFGPRDPVGPDVPLDPADVSLQAGAVVADPPDATGLAQALAGAAQAGKPAVYLPPGLYQTDGLDVPGGLTLIGAGSGTVVRAISFGGTLFWPQGPHVRFTRMVVRGFGDGTWQSWEQNSSRGVEDDGYADVRIDHCDLGYCAYGALYTQSATGQVDHCVIHDDVVTGLGYGVSVVSGSQVTCSDNRFSNCRHCIAAEGSPDFPPGRLMILYNQFTDPTPGSDEQAYLNTHTAFGEGVVVVEGNDFYPHYQEAAGFYAGQGTIDHNRFTLLPGLGEGVHLWFRTLNGVQGVPHQWQIFANTFVNAGTEYQVDAGCQAITIDGTPVAPPALIPTPAAVAPPPDLNATPAGPPSAPRRRRLPARGERGA